MQIITAKNAILTLAMGLFAVCASATTLKVNLPVEASWGGTLLPAGNYTIEYSDGSPLMKLSGAGKQATVLVSRTEASAQNAKSEVTVVDWDGTPTIRSFRSGVSGKTFFFHVNHNKNLQLTAHRKVPTSNTVGTR